jgi:hypothetical protein
MEVVLMYLQVLGELINTSGQNRNLDLRGTSIGLMYTSISDNL